MGFWGFYRNPLLNPEETLQFIVLAINDEKQSNYNIVFESSDACYHKIKQNNAVQVGMARKGTIKIKISANCSIFH